MEPVQRIFWYTHEAINFTFKSSLETFIVEERSDIRFSGKGNNLIVHIQKQSLSTWDLVDLIAEKCAIAKQEIGYAGLKDKYATTTQYISLPKRYKKELLALKDNRIKILNTFVHHEPLRIGDLSGNHFTITLTDVSPIMAGKLEKAFNRIIKEGIPNYFGYQRFGSSFESITEGKEIVNEDKHIQDKRLKKFFINAYSSHLFNAWLAKRVLLKPTSQEPHPFKLLEGDIFLDCVSLKSFQANKLSTAQKSFNEKKIVPTGLVAGRQVKRAAGDAGELEAKFDDISFYNQGYRRAAIIYTSNEDFTYHHKDKRITLAFTLPKSSYATVLLEALGNQAIN